MKFIQTLMFLIYCEDVCNVEPALQCLEASYETVRCCNL